MRLIEKDDDYALIGKGGILKVLFTLGVAMAIHAVMPRKKPKYIQGTSGSAVVLAKLVSENLKFTELMKLCKAMDEGKIKLFSNLSMPMGLLAHRGSLFSDSHLVHLIRQIDAKKIVESDIDFEVTVHRIERRAYSLISNHEERFKENPDLFLKYIQASASLPGLLPAVPIGSQRWYDGQHPDWDRAIERGCNKIIVSMNDQLGSEEDEGLLANLFRAFDTESDESMKLRVAATLCKHPEYTIICNDSHLYYLEEIAEMAKKAGRYGMSDHCIAFVAAEEKIPGLGSTSAKKGALNAVMKHGMDCMKKILETDFEPIATEEKKAEETAEEKKPE